MNCGLCGKKVNSFKHKIGNKMVCQECKLRDEVKMINKRRQICKVNKSFYENIISNFKED